MSEFRFQYLPHLDCLLDPVQILHMPLLEQWLRMDALLYGVVKILDDFTHLALQKQGVQKIF